MQFCSGQLMQFLSGVDNRGLSMAYVARWLPLPPCCHRLSYTAALQDDHPAALLRIASPENVTVAKVCADRILT
jgi:hypothetical protein